MHKLSSEREAERFTSKSPGLVLSWQGKEAAVALAESATSARLVFDQGLSTGSKESVNLVIAGDNLEVLKLLKEYRSAVDVIYIDPPYNTGNKFQYHDRFKSDEEWLNLMLPRLIVARSMLNTGGFIAVSIDDNEVDKLRILLDEVFGRKNFLAQITVKSNPRGRQAEAHFATVHEYVVVYAKDARTCKIAGAPLTDDQLKEFNQMDSNGRAYRLLGLRQRGAASRRQDRPALYYPIFVDPSTGKVSVEKSPVYSAEALPKKSSGADGRWMWCKETVAENIDLVEARLIKRRGEWDIFIRDYLSSENGTERTRKVSTVWDEPEFNYQHGKQELRAVLGATPVDYPKPVALIQRIINLCPNRDSLVLDFFAGTGTTGQAIMECNIADGGSRRFILIQKPEILSGGTNETFATISDICRERVKAAVQRLFPDFSGPVFSYWSLL